MQREAHKIKEAHETYKTQEAQKGTKVIRLLPSVIYKVNSCWGRREFSVALLARHTKGFNGGNFHEL